MESHKVRAAMLVRENLHDAVLAVRLVVRILGASNRLRLDGERLARIKMHDLYDRARGTSVLLGIDARVPLQLALLFLGRCGGESRVTRATQRSRALSLIHCRSSKWQRVGRELPLLEKLYVLGRVA